MAFPLCLCRPRPTQPRRRFIAGTATQRNQMAGIPAIAEGKNGQLEECPRMAFALMCRMGRFLVLLAGMSALAGVAASASAADRKGAVTATVLPATTAPSGAELVGKLLSAQT